MERILTKTLIIRLSSVGDIVLSSLLIRAFHSRFPQCQIEYLVKEEYADLVIQETRQNIAVAKKKNRSRPPSSSPRRKKSSN